jgi:hypothetical protein
MEALGMTPQEKYPALMAYIADRSQDDGKASLWCSRLREDEHAAYEGKLADVVADFEKALADYAVSQKAKGLTTYPYNRDMGLFLGLPINPGNSEPPCGYYMARGVLSHFRLGMFSREVKTLLDDGAHLKLVAARDKKTGRPIRFDTFKPHQVLIEFDKIVCRNDRKQIRLSSNWSIETALEKAAEALRTGKHYGYDPAKDDGPMSSPSVTVVIQPGEPTLFI